MRLTPWIAVLLCLSAWTPVSAASTSFDSTREALERGELEPALTDLEKYHEENAGTAESWYLLGRAYQLKLDEVSVLSKRGVAKSLRRALEKSLGLAPSHAGAREELADFFHYAPRIVGGSKEKAEEQLALLEKTSAAHAHRVRGRYALEDQDWRAAESHLSRSLAARRDPGTLYQRGIARLRQREKDRGAYEDFRAAIDEGYDRPLALYRLGVACIRLADCLDEGMQALNRFLSDTDRYQAHGHYRLAQIHELKGEWEQAIEQATKAAELNPELEDVPHLLERVQQRLREAGLL